MLQTVGQCCWQVEVCRMVFLKFCSGSVRFSKITSFQFRMVLCGFVKKKPRFRFKIGADPFCFCGNCITGYCVAIQLHSGNDLHIIIKCVWNLIYQISTLGAYVCTSLIDCSSRRQPIVRVCFENAVVRKWFGTQTSKNRLTAPPSVAGLAGFCRSWFKPRFKPVRQKQVSASFCQCKFWC